MHVVITGSTKGIGYSLAQEFLRFGDHVLITSRSEHNVNRAINELIPKYPEHVLSKTCDVTKYSELQDLSTFALNQWGSVDIWINNAGITHSYKPLIDLEISQIKSVVDTNTVGTLIGCKVALNLMKSQGFGHIFNMEGMGSNGMLTPRLSVYGTTKNSIPHLTRTLAKEMQDTGIGIHSISPGMVITDLIIPHATSSNASIFNILGEKPETIAKYLVPKIRTIGGTGKHVRYLTRSKIMWRFMTARKRKNRFFDTNGKLIEINT